MVEVIAHLQNNGDAAGAEFVSLLCRNIVSLTASKATANSRRLFSFPGITPNDPLAGPTSPARFRNTMFSADSGSLFSLHFALDYFGGQFEAEFFEKDLLVVGGF